MSERMVDFRRGLLLAALAASPAFADEVVRSPAAETPAPVQKIGVPGIRARGHVGSLTFTPDGKRVLLGLHSTSEVPLFEVETGRRVMQYSAESSWGNACLSRDGARVAAAGRQIQVFDAVTGKASLTLPGTSLGIMPLAFSADGNELFAGNAPGADPSQQVEGWLVSYALDTGKVRLSVPAASKKAWKSLAVSPDGTIVAAGEHTYGIDPCAVVLHDATSGQVLRRLEGATGAVGAIAFSGDGTALAAASEGGRIHVFEVATGKTLFSVKVEGASYLRAVALSAAGRIVAAGGNSSSVHLFDVTSGKSIRNLATSWSFVGGIAFSPDGSRLAAASDSTQDATVELYDLATGERVVSGAAHAGPVDEVAFGHADGVLVTASHGEGSLRTWALPSGDPALSFRPSSNFHFSTAAGAIAVSDGGAVRVFAPETGSTRFAVEADSMFSIGPAFSPDGKRLVTAGASGSVRAWEAADGRPAWTSDLSTDAHGGLVTCLTFDTPGERVGLAIAITGASWSESGTGLLATLDARTGKKLTMSRSLPMRLTLASFDRDGKLVGLGGWLNAFGLFEEGSGAARITVPGDRYFFNCVALAPDGLSLVLGGESSTILRSGPSEAGNGPTVLLGEAVSGRSSLFPVEPMNPAEDRAYMGPTDAVTSVTFSPAGDWIAACFPGGSVRVLRLASPADVRVLRDGAAQLVSVAFSSDGKRLAAGCADGTARIFDLEP